MPIIVPGRIVLATSPAMAVCTASIAENATQTARIEVMSCCIKDLDLCIPQNAAKTFILQDATTVDYSGATEITFDVWESIGGAAVIGKSLTGGGIILTNAYTMTFSLTGAESGAMTPTKKYCEVWVTLSTGERRIAGAGPFRVEDTRKHD